jgi:hypothetical protein
LDEGSFSAAAMKRIYTRLLSHLPYYQQNEHCHLLEGGVDVPGELGPVILSFPLTVLVCNGNAGALDVAEEIQAMLAPRDTMKIKSIENADALLQKLKGTPAGGYCPMFCNL